ncbi:hypothetical protein RJ639_024188 [Escallonia herrerae]|uniref:t-SNARE coiled-coil homology domain-containing protein n=1 Tax=Escallonia herrerae TaxID=1293975 RepID=A0AA88V2C3_9ASTE|nr:hypothetical protein RJ639_024188 [Escallonia herrerae]
MLGHRKSPLNKIPKQKSVDPGFHSANPFDSDNKSDDKQTHKPSRRTSSEPSLVTPNLRANLFDDDEGKKTSSSSTSLTSAARNKYKNDFHDAGGFESQSVQELENYSVYKAQETTKAANNCLKIAEDMRQDATQTLVMLHEQGEQITRTHVVAADIDHDLSRGEKLLGSLGGLFSKTWKPKKTHPIKGPVITRDDPVQRKGNHLEQRDKLGLTPAPKVRSNSRTPPPEPTDAMQNVQAEHTKQDDTFSEISNILVDLKDMAIDMGSEIERHNKALNPLQDDVDELNYRVLVVDSFYGFVICCGLIDLFAVMSANPFDSDNESDNKQTHKPSRRTSSEPSLVTPNLHANLFDDDEGKKTSSSSTSLTSAARNKYKNDFHDAGGFESQSVQELENYSVYKAQETTKAANNCLKIAEDMRQDATQTLVMLHEQGEQITRTHVVAADIDHDLSRGEKLLGSLGGLFSKTWKPKKTHPIKGPVITRDDPVQRKGNHLEQRDKLGLTPAPKVRSNSRTPPPEPTDAMQNVQAEHTKQDDTFSEISNILVDLKDMAIDMGSEIERHNKALNPLQDDVDELNYRLRDGNQRALRLLRK